MSYPLLSKFLGTIKVQELAKHAQLTREIQTLLKAGGFTIPVVSGDYDTYTETAIKAFKKAAFLEHPDLIGASTAQALLEIDGIGEHATPSDDEPVRQPSGKQFRLPGGELVRVDQLIQGSRWFTWNEVTKAATRIPENREIVGRIIKLAKTLDEVRAYLGNREISVNSWYRPPAVNRAVGGVTGSRHLLGDGVDIVVTGMSAPEVYDRLNTWYGKRGGLGKARSFTHLDGRGYSARFFYSNK